MSKEIQTEDVPVATRGNNLRETSWKLEGTSSNVVGQEIKVEIILLNRHVWHHCISASNCIGV